MKSNHRSGPVRSAGTSTTTKLLILFLALLSYIFLPDVLSCGNIACRRTPGAKRKRPVSSPARSGLGKSSASSLPAPPATVPPSIVHELGRGFTCWENLYIVNGMLMAYPGDPHSASRPEPERPYPSPWRRLDTRAYLGGDGTIADVVEMPQETAELLAQASLESSPSALIMNEWKPPGQAATFFTSHYGHFVEEVAGGLMLQAAAGIDRYHMGLCCRCKENYAGEGLPLNRWVMDTLWGSTWQHCNDYSEQGLYGHLTFPQDRAPAQGKGAGKGPVRMERACIVDRYLAHRDWHTDAVNNCNALLVRHAKPELQRAMETNLRRFRAHPFIAKADLADLKDLYGTSIAEVVAKGRAGGPLITLVQRKPGIRAFAGQSFEDLVRYIKDKHGRQARALAVRWELLPTHAQLALASSTDVMIGMQGNGLSHLFWMPIGSAVLEMFPHFYRDGGGTAWTNDWPWLTRMKGCIYRSADTQQGATNPVAHPVKDQWEYMSTSDSPLDMAGIGPLVDETLDTWRRLQEEMSRAGGWDRVDMRLWWNPGWTPDQGEEVFYQPQGWHPNHNHSAFAIA